MIFTHRSLPTAAACALILSGFISTNASAQSARADDAILEEVVVTGTRIRKNPLNEPTAVLSLGEEFFEDSGLTNLGDMLQRLPIATSAINTRFNVPGNSGFPQDGTGIGAGASRIALRNLGARRTLVLVDGKRFIAGASASGVPLAVDLNTLAPNMIERIEILQSGASAIYGSDAIGGVVNIFTHKTFEGFEIDLQGSQYLEDGDGEDFTLGFKFGTKGERSHVVIGASYTEERGIETFDRRLSRFPTPNASSCDVSPPGCSSFTPQGRFIFGPNFAGGGDITLNNGVLNDGTTLPQFDAAAPGTQDFHNFTNADRFNFNGPGFNFLRTPNERVNLFANVTYDISDTVRFVGQAVYTNRQSDTKGAPEPLCLGNGCGNPFALNTIIHQDNPFNPFGATLSTADGTLDFFGRRPLESGGRLFSQDVDTYFASGSLEGELNFGGRSWYWDLNASFGENRGTQEKQNSHNQARLAVALGDPAVCALVPGCVPFNFFGGQGPNGTGTITDAMLGFVGFTQRDASEQDFKNFSFNISGDLLDLPAGNLGFAAGAEYRDHDGSFSPDPVAASGETAGIPSGPTAGDFDVTELYAEVSVPIATDQPGIDYLEVNAAIRYSDYSTVGSEETYLMSALYRPIDSLSLRGAFSTGIRAPGIGELFGGAAREDFTFNDPCSDYLALAGSGAGGRDTPQSAGVIAACQNLGIPNTFVQLNPQVSAVSRGNERLKAETSDNFSLGIVYSPNWVEDVAWIDSLTASVDYYDIEIDDAIQGRNPGDVASACIQTLDPFFCNNVDRSALGSINLVNNQLQNIGGIETSGLDIVVNYRTPDTDVGQFELDFKATNLREYTERTEQPGGGFTSTDFEGTVTDETFQRAFPEWKYTARFNWFKEQWGASLAIRYVGEMDEFNSGALAGTQLDGIFFTDLQVNYTVPLDNDELRFSLGSNNVLDEDPETCANACGIIGMSPVAHDLPGRTLYFRASYRR